MAERDNAIRMNSAQLEYSIKLQKLIEAFCRGDDPLPYPELWHSKKLTALRLHKCPEVMNPPASAAPGAEAGNLNPGHVIGHGVRPRRAAKVRRADAAPPPTELNEWDQYEEDGPRDLEDQLESALNEAFPSQREGKAK